MLQTVLAWKARLHAWGYEPLFCSVESKYGLNALADNLKEQTTVIVGPSGVGKSSLINALRGSQHDSDQWLARVRFTEFAAPLFFFFFTQCTMSKHNYLSRN